MAQDLERGHGERDAHHELAGADAGAVGHHPTVTGTGQDAPAGHRRAVDRGHRRLGKTEQGSRARPQPRHEALDVVRAVVDHAAEVDPGREDPARHR